ncbi:MAG: DUF935 family protein, partial [Candidatus Subteraquimicrobiales bacterium]|nr:DUF935 family protein [Candidatus Subteraquimicrobiales bacterium]
MVIELLEAARQGTVNTYETLCNFMDRQIAQVMLGHTGTSESTPGKLGSEDAAQEVRQDYIKSDADLLCESENNQMIRWTVDYNFPDVSRNGYPKVWIRTALEEDLKPLAERDKILAVDIGVPIGKKYFYDTYGIPKPEEGEETVSVQQSAIRGQQRILSSQGDEIDDESISANDVGKRLQTTQSTVLNGAQVTAATAIVVAVADGQIPRDAGMGQLMILFNLTKSQAEQVMGSAGTKTPTTPNPRPGVDEEATGYFEKIIRTKNKKKNFADATISDQQDIETLADNSISGAALDLSPLQKIIDSAESYEDLQKKIQQAYGGLDLTQFRSILERA